jgi:hypothetical protein
LESPIAVGSIFQSRDSFNRTTTAVGAAEGTEHSSRARDIARTHVVGTRGAATASLADRRYAAASLGDRRDASPDGRGAVADARGTEGKSVVGICRRK